MKNPVKRIGEFQCSDPLLNDIWETGVNTLTVSMQDHYPGDARVHALINYYVFGNTKLTGEALRLFAQNKREDGNSNLVWVMMLKDHHDFAVDQLLLEKLFPNLERLMDLWYPSQEGENSLLVFEPEAVYNAFYYKALKDASILAARARHFDRAEEWRNRAERVCRLMNERLWDEKKGVYADCRVVEELSETVSEQANYLAILFDVADELQTERIMHYLDSGLPIIKSAGSHFNFYVLETLAKVGRYQQALDIIRRDGGSSSIYWLMKHIAGIQLPDDTSRRPYLTGQQLCDLEWVKARMYEVSVEHDSKVLLVR